MFSTTNHHDDHHSSTEHHDHDSHDDHDHHDHDDEYSSSDIGLAITFVFLAGMMIAVGGALSFLIPKKYTKVLPIALAFSAGVLIYLAFIEVFEATYHGFESTDAEEWVVHIYTSLTFFCGIIIGGVLEFIVHKLGGGHDHHGGDITSGNNDSDNSDDDDDDVVNDKLPPQNTKGLKTIHVASKSDDNIDIKATANANANANTNANDASPNINESQQEQMEKAGQEEETEKEKLKQQKQQQQGETRKERTRIKSGLSVIEEKQLMRVSFATAVALSLHNLPEGLATFVGTIADPAIGFSICIAVAIHNLPLGVSIATPVYIVTQSKWKAIGVSCIAAITQPIGGLIGLIVIHSGVSDVSFAVMFGITGGLMVFTCFRELLPAARMQDPNDQYTSLLVFIGMVVLDISLILFDSTGTHEH